MAGLVFVKKTATPENLRAGLVAIADKGRELAEAAPAATVQVRDA